MDRNDEEGVRLFIDESGNMGKSGRFLVFPVVYFNSKQEYKKWTRLAKKYTQSNKYLQKRGEIKCSSMRYEEKKELFIALHKRNVDFKIWCGVIDTNHEHYVERFISGRNPKELSFNYVLNQLFQRYIAKTIVSQTVKMYIDNRNLKTGSLYTLEGYINVESMHNKNHRCERVDVRYRDSKDCYGIQLADLIANIIFIRYEYGSGKDIFDKYIKPKLCATLRYPNC